MNKSVLLQTVKFTAITAIAAISALVCAGCTGIDEDSSKNGGILDGFLGVPYTIKFDSQGGSEVASQEISLGGRIKEPAKPTRTGYTFDGWSQNKNSYDTWSFGNGVTSNMTLYARWTLNTYRVSLDFRGGYGSFQDSYNNWGSSPVSVKYGDTIWVTPWAERTNYTFSGWYTDSAYTSNPWNFGKDVVKSDMTLYAKWTLNTYTVKFIVANEKDTVVVDSQVVDHGGKVIKPDDLDSAGYHFDGWGWNFDRDTVTRDMTFAAKWTRITHTVTFNLQGGSIYVNGNNTSSYTQRVYYGGKVTKPDRDPTRNSQAFGGWYKDAACTVPFDFTTEIVTSDITIYAKWIPYTVKFNSNGGSAVDSQLVDHGGKVTKPEDPVRADYKLDSWWAVSNNNWYSWNFDTSTVTRDTTLRATWTRVPGIPTPDKTTFIDDRDDKEYKKVTIGTQVWMAENLNYDVPDVTTACARYNDEGCNTYGRLYDWATAMGIDTRFNSYYWDESDVKHQGVCPAGWHLPNDAEWDVLVYYVGGADVAGTKLKTQTTAWGSYYGTDEYGFSALPRDTNNYNISWWSATNFNSGPIDNTPAGYWNISTGSRMNSSNGGKTNQFSVRCVED